MKIKDLQERISLKRRDNDSRRSFLLNLKNNLDKTKYSQYGLFKKQISDKKKIHLIGNIQRVDASGEKIRDDFNIDMILQMYSQTDISALCIVTESYFFQGRMNDVQRGIANIHVPILMRDIVIDELQLYEARHSGASAIWLMVEILSDEQLKLFSAIAENLDLDIVFEVKTLEEYYRMVAVGGQIMAMEKQFTSLMNEIQNISSYMPSLLTVVYGDIIDAQEIKLLKQQGFSAVLVEEFFLKNRDIIFQVNKFLSRCLFSD